MYTLKGSVGKGQANHPADVAFVQFALKVISVKGKTYGSESITGKYTEKLGENIIDLPGAGSIKGIRQHDGTGVVTSLSGLLSLIPAKYNSFQFKFEKVGNTSLAYLVRSNQQNNVAKYKPEALSLPNAEAKALVAIFQTVVRVYNVKPEIEKITVDHNGYFGVQLKLSGGQFLDPKTAEIVAVDKQHVKERIITFMGPMVKAGKLHAKTLWEFIGREKIILKSSKQYSFLKIKNRDLALLTWGFRKFVDPLDKEVTQLALSAYETLRLGAVLDRKTERLIIEIFGKNWPDIYKKMQDNAVIAQYYTKLLDQALLQLRQAQRTGRNAENLLREALNIPKIDHWDHGLSLAKDLAIAGFGFKATSVVKKGLQSKGANEKVAEAVADIIVAPIETSVSISTKAENDTEGRAFEAILLGVTVVAAVMVVVGTFGAGAGVLAVVGTIGTFLSKAALGVSVAEDLYGYIDAYIEEAKLGREIANLNTLLKKKHSEYNLAFDRVLVVFAALKSETDLSLADFGFSKEELDAAVEEIKSIGSLIK